MQATINSFNYSQNATVYAPPSKSMAHRALMCAALANGESRIHGISTSQDMQATIRAMKALGAQITYNEKEKCAIVKGVSSFETPLAPIDCGESGSTLRFIIPVFSLVNAKVSFTGHGRLPSRPQAVYANLFKNRNLSFEQNENSITINGALTNGEYVIDGSVSSQFITGLLFALPLLKGDSVIKITPPFESKSYVDLTIKAMADFGVFVNWENENTIAIKGNQQFKHFDYVVEGDCSQGAFWAVLGACMEKGSLKIENLRKDTLQGDNVIFAILQKCGAQIEVNNNSVVVHSASGNLVATEIDLADCPDLGPILMILALFCKGETVIKNAGRLRIKESDRIAAMECEIGKIGGTIKSEGDTVYVTGCANKLQGSGEIQSHNDHRIVMALSVAAALIWQSKGGICKINNAEAIEKSYPNFFEDLHKVGADIRLESERKPKENICIVGLGLLGGSYAMGLTNAGYNVTAIDVKETAISYALDKKIIADGKVENYETLLQNADIVIVCLYPTASVEWLSKNAEHLKKGALITDVCGVKCAIVEKIQNALPQHVEFIAAHPMAGREVSGVENANITMFKGANYIVVPTEKNTQRAIEKAIEIGEVLQFGNITTLTCKEHDEMIAYVSQLTHAIAVSLMNATDNTHLSEYTGDSFRDLTRIAKINATMWRELFLLNSDVLITEIDQFTNSLSNLRQKLVENDAEGLEELFVQSTQRRLHFDKKDRNSCK